MLKNKAFLGVLGCLGLIVVGVLIVAMMVMGTYNSLVSLEETVNEKWAQVENVYQRRADLIPNLVNTVKGYAAHEKETLQSVIEARAKATQPSVQLKQAPTPEQLAQFQQAQGALSSALSRLMVVVERYPELKANQNFLALQSQLEGTENRITVERMRYNEVVKNYNIKTRRFPSNIIANLFGFEKKALFEAEEGAEKAPKVEF